MKLNGKTFFFIFLAVFAAIIAGNIASPRIKMEIVDKTKASKTKSSAS